MEETAICTAKKSCLASVKEAIQVLLRSNFDTASIECLRTIVKILDNILLSSSSSDSHRKFRQLRANNPAVRSKILSKKGGPEILSAVGFTLMKNKDDVSNTISLVASEDGSIITLREDREDASLILTGRNMIANVLVGDLGVPERELPVLKLPLPLAAAAAGVAVVPDHEFNPITGHQSFSSSKNHSGQKTISRTERELETLKAKRSELERRMQQEEDIIKDRGIVAYLPGEETRMTTKRRERLGNSDASLLAGLMKRREEEKRKRDDGGFTTRAIRELEKLRKVKVYSHVQLRIYLPDGSRVEIMFLPNETILTVRKIIHSCLIPSIQKNILQKNKGGDQDGDRCDINGLPEVYVTPPRRTLSDSKTLEEEGLVPAARLHISWNGVGRVEGPSSPGSFLREDLFSKVDIPDKSSSIKSSFPNARDLVDNAGAVSSMVGCGKEKGRDGIDSKKKISLSREEEMMRKMMGK